MSEAIVEAVASAAYERDRRAAYRSVTESTRRELSGPWESLGHRDDPGGIVRRYIERARADIRAHVVALEAAGFIVVPACSAARLT